MLTPHQILFGDLQHKNRKKAQQDVPIDQFRPVIKADHIRKIPKRAIQADQFQKKNQQGKGEEHNKAQTQQKEAEDAKPSNRPVIETATGEIRKQYTPEEVGKREIETQAFEGRKRFQTILSDSNNVLFKTKTVFPFDLFPDSIVIDLVRVNVVSRQFFMSARVHSIEISDISDVYVDTGPFLSKLSIISKSGPEKNLVISDLKTNEATKMRRIIQGLVMVKGEEINIRALDDQDLIKKLEEVGSIKQAS